MKSKISDGNQKRFGQPKSFNLKNVEKVPDNKPVVYEGLNQSRKNLYTGIAQRGRVQERLKEHLNQKDLPGVKQFRVKQVPSIREARQEEKKIIERENPKLNKT